MDVLPANNQSNYYKAALEGCPKHSTENGTKRTTIDFSRKIKKCLKEALKKLH